MTGFFGSHRTSARKERLSAVPCHMTTFTESVVYAATFALTSCGSRGNETQTTVP